MSLEVEMKAMAKVAKAVENLDEDQRARVLEYVRNVMIERPVLGTTAAPLMQQEGSGDEDFPISF